MSDTLKSSNKKILVDITTKNNVPGPGVNYKKSCPQCGGDQIYRSRGGLTRALVRNTLCYPCMGQRKILSAEEKQKRVVDVNIYKKQWGQNNIDKVRESRRVWTKNNPDKVKNKQLVYNYGITLEEYDQMLILQNHRCKICQKHQSELTKPLCVDHCHTTGKVRGMVCDSCNLGMGRFYDDPELLIAAANYLTKNRL